MIKENGSLESTHFVIGNNIYMKSLNKQNNATNPLNIRVCGVFIYSLSTK